MFTVVLPEPVVTVAMPAWLASAPAVSVEAPMRVTDSTRETLVNWASVIVPASLITNVSEPPPPSTESVLVRPATVKRRVSLPPLPRRFTSPLVEAVIVSALPLPSTVSKPEMAPVPVAVPLDRFTLTALP